MTHELWSTIIQFIWAINNSSKNWAASILAFLYHFILHVLVEQ